MCQEKNSVTTSGLGRERDCSQSNEPAIANTSDILTHKKEELINLQKADPIILLKNFSNSGRGIRSLLFQKGNSFAISMPPYYDSGIELVANKA